MKKEFELEILELIGVSGISLIIGFVFGWCCSRRSVRL